MNFRPLFRKEILQILVGFFCLCIEIGGLNILDSVVLRKIWNC